jgi:hypothetical protein
MRNAKLRLILIAVAAMVASLFSSQTLAYYAVVGTATNVVTSGSVHLQINERTADGSEFPEEGVYVIPGMRVGKRVTVENICEHPFYLRVRLVSGVNNEQLSAEDCLEMDLNLTDWILRDDGYLYYNKAVQPGEETNPVFTWVEIVGAHVDNSYIGSALTLTVDAYAVQSENNPADVPWEAQGWPEPEGGQV